MKRGWASKQTATSPSTVSPTGQNPHQTASGKRYLPTMKMSSLLQRLWLIPWFWVVIDALLINAAFSLAYHIRYELQWLRAVDPANNVPLWDFAPFVLLLTVVLLTAYYYQGLYRVRRRLSWVDEVSNIFTGTSLGIVMMIVIIFLYRPTFYSRIIFLYTGGLILFLLGLSRWVRISVLHHWRRKGFNVQRLLIVGAGEMGRVLMRAVMANASLGYQIIGFVDDDVDKSQTDIGRFEALGNLQNLPKLLDEKDVDEVIITLPWQYQRKIMSVTATCHRKNIRSRVVPGMFQMAMGRMEISEMAGIPLLGTRPAAISGMNIIIKRVIDFTLALIALIFLSPLMTLIALAIKMDSAGPAIFSQERLGRNMKPFRVYKFRSMVKGAEAQKPALEAYNEAEGPLFKIKDDPRRTRVGRFLRKFSLDELPQFYNVLKGDMSLVGPRPNLPAEVEHYKHWHKRRLEVMPGITGLWAIHGRSELPFDEVVLLDLYYIENWSLMMDVKILLQTIPRVLLGSGSY